MVKVCRCDIGKTIWAGKSLPGVNLLNKDCMQPRGVAGLDGGSVLQVPGAAPW